MMLHSNHVSSAVESVAIPTCGSANGPRPLHVLVVDDDRDTAEITAQLVRLWGHEASAALDGRTALKLAAAIAPDVVLLDLGLPGFDGFQVAEALRERIGTSVFLVAVTGYGQEEMRRHSYEAGFDLYLLKPVEPACLRGLLETHARVRRS